MENVASDSGPQQEGSTATAIPATTIAGEPSSTTAAPAETPQKQQGDQPQAGDEDEEDEDFDELDGEYPIVLSLPPTPKHNLRY